MKTKKSILAIKGLDGEYKAICPDCKQKMVYRDLGVSQYMSGGELIERDYGGFWECQNTDCGYQSDE